MKTEKLKEVLGLHEKWVKSDNGQRADLQGADLQGADLQGAYLRRADLRRADLRRADLQEADLRRADLRGAYLQGADLQGAYLQGADLRGAYLQGADLQGADLQGADLQGADLQGVILEEDYVLTSSNCRYLQLSDYYCWIFSSKKGLVMKIGCECHLVEEWRNYTDQEILGMDGRSALKFWRKEKEILMIVCDSMKV